MIEIRERVEIAPLTTFRVGGTSRYFVAVSSEEELAEALAAAKERKVPVFILGGGSNVLFGDRTWPGMVIRMEDRSLQEKGTGIFAAGAGVLLRDILLAAVERGWSGMERMAGIPGTIGGAICGNSGAFGVETASFVREVRVYDSTKGSSMMLTPEECAFGYHESRFKKESNLIILGATLAFHPGAEPDELRKIVRETIEVRERKHPQDAFCAGSFFMNPIVKDVSLRRKFESDTGATLRDDRLPAGWLVDQSGLRGKQIGGAKVSDLHSNYIVSIGTATAEDVVMLASVVKQRVRICFGVSLHEEVQLAGFDARDEVSQNVQIEKEFKTL